LRLLLRQLLVLMPDDLYGDQFYASQIEGSLKSARIFLECLFSIWKPGSVVDIGCGRGTWLAACGELGIERLVGIDGNWVSQENMLSPSIEFRAADLDSDIPTVGTFDLAMSLEVAEHLQPASSERFADALTRHSDAILFSAAFAAQPGTNHINTRLHSYWGEMFLNGGYRLFDFFRPRFWSDRRVEPWYRQNTFLYVKTEHPLFDALTAAGERAAEDARFVDAVHPWLYFEALGEIERLQKAGRGPSPPEAVPSRNAPCPCGSGKRYKHCHGKLEAADA
jgi:SAM-dependent methyltransferase